MSTTLGKAMALGNDAGGLAIKNVGAPVAATDAARLQDIDANAPMSGDARFVSNGTIVVATKIDGAYICPFAGTIQRVTLYRRTAGASGSTTVDVNKNGTTIYTTQANRPSVLFSAGNDAVNSPAPDVTAVAQDDRIEVDIDAIETGSPADVVVQIQIKEN